ncbi:ribonuclease H-like domain-containing protein [Tanacetum coccineum]
MNMLITSTGILDATRYRLPLAFSTTAIQDPTWNMDTGASSHLNSHTSNLNTVYNKCLYVSVCVGDGKSIPVTNTGHSILPTLNRPLYLHNVPVTPNIIKNLIYVLQFTRDNNCIVEFDAFGFSVKDFLSRHILLRCDSSGDLYPVTQPSPIPHALLSVNPTTWHRCLGLPGEEVLRSLVSRQFITCTNEKSPHICHACQLGKHVRLSFSSSNSVVTSSFEIVHYDIWTSPISLFFALSDPNWRDAMYDEYNALIKNGTWILVPKPPNVNVVRSMWLFRHKYHADDSLSRYKARLVANGSTQQLGVDCDDTFSSIVKPATIRVVLSLALSRNWPIHQLDVKNSFFNGYALQFGFSSSRCDSSLFIYRRGTKVAYFVIYVDDMLLDKAHMANCKPTWTPVDTESKLGSDGDPDPSLYRSLAGVLRYVRGTLDFGLQLYTSSIGSLVAYSDADWAGFPTTRRSTSGYCVFLGDNLLSWSSKRQHTLSRSSVEAEYRGVSNAVAETAWLRNLLRKLHTPIIVRVLHLPSRYQYADIFTKGLPSALFEEFRTSLSVRPSPAQTAGEC